jgi:hypothetical protein
MSFSLAPLFQRAVHSTARVVRSAWAEHGWPLLLYLVLTIALTWPLLPNFTTKITGVGDSQHLLWMMWHTQQALLGREPLFSTSLVYYPYGTSLWTCTFVPLAGVFAFPFWWLGTEAAYNGALLIGFWLTGYCGYLLGRSLKFSRSIAFFAGTVLLVAPIHLTAIISHMHKIFLGGSALTLLALNRALDLRRRPMWAVATGCALLLTLFESSDHLVLAGLAVVFFVMVAWLEADRVDRRKLTQRILLIGISALVLTGPFVVMIMTAASNPAVSVSVSQESLQHQPDLIKFFVPMEVGPLGNLFWPALYPRVRGSIETAVFLGWTSLVLLIVAIASRQRAARRWIWLVIFCVIIALGPTLMILGERYFTSYKLPIIMPYALLSDLPGLSFWRTPGRMMLVGFIGLGIAAGFGLAWLVQRVPIRWRGIVPIVAVLLVLFESWPRGPQLQEQLPPVPPFYQQIAHDPAHYGVFDLPIRPYQALDITSDYVPYSARYQMYQMTHHKGIASGYISRYYSYHPVFAQLISRSPNDSPRQSDVMLNGQPANRYADAEYELARNDYRYVVLHKPQPDDSVYQPGSWGEQVSRKFIKQVFGDRAPLVDDAFTTVYPVRPITDVTTLTPTIVLRESLDSSNYEIARGRRWALSPATFYVASPRVLSAYLKVTPGQIENAQTNAPAATGQLTLQTPDGRSVSVLMSAGQPVLLPLALSPGSQIITLTLQPTRTQATDASLKYLNFAIGSIDLRTAGHFDFAPDVLVDGRPQSNARPDLAAILGEGWHDRESEGTTDWRWAKSPATLWVYSAQPRRITLDVAPVFLHEPVSPNRLGDRGVMSISTDTGFQAEIALQTGQRAASTFDLTAGWNRVTFALSTGNFQPEQIGLPDGRSLSFAVGSLNLH